MGSEERQRPPVPNIPGLTKGKIEARGEIWASRRRVGFSENKSDLFVISKEMELFLRAITPETEDEFIRLINTSGI